MRGGGDMEAWCLLRVRMRNYKAWEGLDVRHYMGSRGPRVPWNRAFGGLRMGFRIMSKRPT